MSLAEQMFQEMANAPMFGSGQWFHEGKFIVAIKLLKKNDGFNGKFLIAEFEVLRTSNEEDPIGATRSYLINLDTTKNRNCYSDAKKLGFALLGMDPDSVPNEPKTPGLINVTLGGRQMQITAAQAHAEAARLVAAIIDPDFARANGIDIAGTFTNMQLAVETWGKPKKKSEGVYTVHKWKPLAMLTAEQIAAIVPPPPSPLTQAAPGFAAAPAQAFGAVPAPVGFIPGGVR